MRAEGSGLRGYNYFKQYVRFLCSLSNGGWLSRPISESERQNSEGFTYAPTVEMGIFF
jgi:hypothetical protein